MEQLLKDKPSLILKIPSLPPKDSLAEDSMMLLFRMIERICPIKSSNTQVVMPGFKFKGKLTLLLKWVHLSWWKWKRLPKAIWEKQWKELSSQFQPISMTLNVKQQKMLEKLQDYKYKELSMNLQLQPSLMVCKRKKIKQLQSMIWEEEHLIFQFLKFLRELLK